MCCIGKCARKCCEGICALLFSAGVLVLIYWAIFQPRHIRAAVDSAALSNLTVVSTNASSSSSAISYNLAVNLSLYNPNVRVNIYYDTIAARLRFRDSVLGPAANTTSPSEFFQRRKTGNVVKLEFDGSGGVGVDGGVAGELEKETRGEVKLELDVDVRVRYVFRIFKLRQKPRIRCWLSIPVRPEGRGAGVGGALDSGGRCRVKY